MTDFQMYQLSKIYLTIIVIKENLENFQNVR